MIEILHVRIIIELTLKSSFSKIFGDFTLFEWVITDNIDFVERSHYFKNLKQCKPYLSLIKTI